MIQTTSFSTKVKRFFSLLLPILITQIALFSMVFFDTVMSGQASPEDLAGVAVGGSIWLPVSTGLNGILMAVTPMIAHHLGAKEHKKIASVVIQALFLSVCISIVVIVIGFFSLNPILNGMTLEDEVRRIAHDYLVALSFGIIPLFAYTVVRGFIDALGKTKVTMVITLISLPINVTLNYMLIFGKMGFPALGGVGAGIASAVTYWLILGISIYLVRSGKKFQQFHVLQTIEKPSMRAWGMLLKLGIPIGLSIFFETSIFAIVTLLMSNFDTTTIAAHQAAMNFASLMYMSPLSISFALTIVVGYEVGAGRYRDAKQYSLLGIGTAVAISALCALILYFFNEEVAGMYTNEWAVQELAMIFLLYAILFQVSDAVAAPIQGILRGYKDVNLPLIIMLISYWVIGLPVGYVLANYTDWGAQGYWVGLILGLAFGAVFLSVRLHLLQKRKIKEEVYHAV
ncbi:MATE family efflux transporter [Priestia taiwanensis]|uniref:Probable multidrug resistance protein NorM n=1 Tax=Priestia taiwanensis TaxID=1347902 RepID=A0A917ESL2_9BACI|nr:MATE family efflux transporter [Priestia taiwanensis]MBM7363725.1 MATE family multidrug resistance protein [Priestia taiwanensis]GGE74659.1 putative multidrug resistance protein NorM [Priestia taiwanensis]